jgi:hypothetical protein
MSRTNELRVRDLKFVLRTLEAPIVPAAVLKSGVNGIPISLHVASQFLTTSEKFACHPTSNNVEFITEAILEEIVKCTSNRTRRSSLAFIEVGEEVMRHVLFKFKEIPG